jgi:hypothetical protein
MTLAKQIEKLGHDQAKADADRSGGSLHYVPPTTTEILDTVRDAATGVTTAWFVFDFMIIHSVQSGSDWYTHFVYAGRARFRDDKLVDSKLERLREANVSEHSMEWAPAAERYDHDAVRRADRDAWWKKARAHA